jgi:hypothetical protein
MGAPYRKRSTVIREPYRWTFWKWIVTPEGETEFGPGDWIVRGGQGSYSPSAKTSRG